MTEIRTDLHAIIENLNDAQIEELRQIVNERFSPPATPKLTERPIGLRRGALKYMADDFDDPLDCFKEYMP
ncbi:MAG: hypothetical protein WBA23_17470 [Tunicatimonas sp.]|uniref:hypothetical protein n=1 Tax=Tunicatimonas sp. TaxID=1940096 RepID=UPI003C72E868